MKWLRRRNLKQGLGRRGTAAVELAPTAPILVAVAFGTIEVCQLINVKQSLCLAAYEAGRLAIRRDATVAYVNAKAQSICAARGIANPTIEISPAGLAGVTTGTQVQVTVSANFQQSGVAPLVLSTSTVITSTIILISE